MRDAESANNALPYEVLHVFGRYGCKRFGLNAFGEVVDYHEEELGLPFSWRKVPIVSISQMVNGHGEIILCSSSGLV